jgi:ribosomal protein S18 acetylase RimI-like enzyme
MPLRRAARTDVAAMLRLLTQDQIAAERDDPAGDLSPYLAAFDAIAADPNNGLFVWDEGGTVIGCFQLTFLPGLLLKGGWRAQLEGVRVEASHRGRRIGEQMVAEVVKMARARGCRVVQLTTNKQRLDAQRFYRRLGFVASHEGMKLEV